MWIQRPKYGWVWGLLWGLGFFVVVVVLSSECPSICLFLRDALHFLNALHFYRSSLPESSQFITVWENGNREHVRDWIKTPVCNAGAHISQNFLRSSNFRKKKRNSVLCSSWNNPEIPESWGSNRISQTAYPSPERVQNIPQTVCASVWFRKWHFHIRKKCLISKDNLWAEWHHWKSEITGVGGCGGRSWGHFWQPLF